MAASECCGALIQHRHDRLQNGAKGHIAKLKYAMRKKNKVTHSEHLNFYLGYGLSSHKLYF